VIPIIRGNETAGTPASGRKKRSAEEIGHSLNLDMDKWARPDWVKATDRAARSIKSPSLEERIAKKQRRTHEMLMAKRSAPAVEAHGRHKRSTDEKITLESLKEAVQDEVAAPKQKVVSKFKRDDSHHRQKRQAFDQVKYDRMMAIIEHKESVNKDNCYTFKDEELELPGDVAYGVEKQFSSQARTALRLSHFLSNFLQNIDLYEEYGNLRGDKLLNIELLFGEALANVMGDLKIKGSGVFYDIDKFKGPDLLTRQFFGPYAYRYEKEDEGGDTGDRANTHFRAIDFAGFEDHYLDASWFKNVKERWQSNTYGLTKFTEKPLIRSDLAGTSLKKFELYPLYYRAPAEKDGWWSAPYFDCNGYVNDWIISYSVPFFGQNSIGSAIEFK
jgi:hypothetical protein